MERGATTPLAKIRFGSHLYGTNTPASDIDLKSIHIPSARGILLGLPEDVLHLGSKAQNNAQSSGYWSGRPRANTFQDVDHESMSLAKLFGMLKEGDMNAIELLFAPTDRIEETSSAWNYLVSPEVRKRLIDRRCTGFVGYCQGQATRYGIRASRIDEITQFRAALTRIAAEHPEGLQGRAKDCLEQLVSATAANPEISWAHRYSGKSPDLLHISICGRLAAITERMQQLSDIADGILKKYGRRAHAASVAGGYDFRALSHAIRVGREAVELLSTGSITFPLPSASELVAIKLGRVAGPRVLEMLDGVLDDVENASKGSALREGIDWEFCQNIQAQFYAEKITTSGI